MPWTELLQPDLILEGSVLNLTPNIIQQYQLKGLVLDVDETLVPIKATEASPVLQQWVEETRQVASLWLVSNNLSDTRIGGIARSLNLPYTLGAVKPSRRKLRQAVTAMNLPVEQVAMVGDRLFTDVLAGNRLGMFTILVEPIVAPGEAVRSYPIRSFEVLVSQFMGASLVPKHSLSTQRISLRQQEERLEQGSQLRAGVGEEETPSPPVEQTGVEQDKETNKN